MVQATEDSQLPDPNYRTELWRLLGAQADLIPELVDSGVFWDGSRLLVSAGFLQTAEWCTRLSHLLLSCWHLEAFSASRWLTVGASCRGYLLAATTGFFKLLEHLRDKQAVTEFEHAGVQNLDLECVRFMASVALIAYVPEACLGCLLEDSRLGRNIEHVHTTVLEELSFLEHIGFFPWVVLAEMCDWTPFQLRHQVLRGAMISYAFLQHRLWSTVSGFPWCLGQGPIHDNLVTLQAGERPSEAVAAKIYDLMHSGYNMHALESAVGMMMEASWTSFATEKQHASSAVMRKFHSDAGDKSITQRAFLHSFCQLLPGESTQDKHLRLL